MNLGNRMYLVVADDDRLCVFNSMWSSMSTDWSGTTKFEVTCDGKYRTYRRSIDLPITEKEIAELFLEKNESLEEEPSNEQDLYPFR